MVERNDSAQKNSLMSSCSDNEEFKGEVGGTLGINASLGVIPAMNMINQ